MTIKSIPTKQSYISYLSSLFNKSLTTVVPVILSVLLLFAVHTASKYLLPVMILNLFLLQYITLKDTQNDTQFDWLTIIFLFFLVGLYAPITEELIYRKCVIEYLTLWKVNVFSVKYISCIAFAIIHATNYSLFGSDGIYLLIYHVVNAYAAGNICYTLYTKNHLGYSIAFHVTWNTFTLLSMVIMKRLLKKINKKNKCDNNIAGNIGEAMLYVKCPARRISVTGNMGELHEKNIDYIYHYNVKMRPQYKDLLKIKFDKFKKNNMLQLIKTTNADSFLDDYDNDMIDLK